MPRGVYERKKNPIGNLRPRPVRTPEERFWGKVDREGPIPDHQPDLGPCWLWTGGLDGRGYGKLQVGTLAAPKLVNVARFSYEIHFGKPSNNVLHRCDVRRCVRPTHLFDGTAADNAADMVAKGRQARGERVRGVKLTAAQVLEIRSLYRDGIIKCSAKVAAHYGISYFSLRHILRGETWRHL